jgi:hypothetical protein
MPWIPHSNSEAVDNQAQTGGADNLKTLLLRADEVIQFTQCVSIIASAEWSVANHKTNSQLGMLVMLASVEVGKAESDQP